MKIIKKLNDGGNIFVIIGDVGSGKTSITNSYVGKKLVISFDSSYSSLNDDGNLTVLEPETEDFNNPQKWIKEISEYSSDVGLVVFDNLSALQNTIVDGCISGKIGNNTNPMAAYGYFQSVLIKLMQWCIKQKQNILFTAWSTKKPISETKYLIEPDVNDKAFNLIAGYAKMVSRTVAGFDDYEVIVNPDGNGIIKNRMGDKITKQSVKNEDFWKAINYAVGRQRCY